ncbi:unnamed protein product [Paramecium sonneborni]|uniref:WD40-repeat-containing domain n=1 Tax=Paramecium sonneborni TaxID=65129 RepID=A0A8S1RSW3_9CILI|nr:unnamed protein product [Paramecium sonneborni]
MNCINHRSEQLLISVNVKENYVLNAFKSMKQMSNKIDRFGEIVIKKLKESKLDETFDQTNQRINFTSVLSQIGSMMKNIWENITEQINYNLDMIEQENKQFINLINENMNLAESSELDLEKLVQIFQGSTLNLWNTQKDLYLMKLDKTRKWLYQEVQAFIENIKKEMNQFDQIGKSTVEQENVKEETQLDNTIIKFQVQQQLPQDDQQSQQINYQLSLLKQEQYQSIQQMSQFNIKPFTYQKVKKNSIQQQESCYAVAFNKDCSIVAASGNQLIKIYEFRQGKLKLNQVLNEQQKTYVTALHFMQKFNQLISGNGDGSIFIWSINKNNQWICQYILKEHYDRINCLIINNNEDIIISSSSDFTIKFWINLNGWICQQTIVDHKNQVFQLSLNEQQNRVISCGYDQLILIIEYQEYNKKWIVIQKVNVDCCGFRICFIKDNLFTFQPKKGNQMHVYEMNNVSKQFTKTKNIPLNQSGNDNKIYFQQQYIKQKQLVLNKHDKNINLIRITQNDEVKVEQSIQFNDYCFFGQMSDDGEYLIIQVQSSKEIQIWKYTEK